MNSPPSYTLINQQGQLMTLLEALDRSSEVALDTEADNLFHYNTRVCLLQLLVDGRIFLVDLVEPLDLAEFWPRLRQKHLIMHGSDFDLRLLHDLCGFVAVGIFDTMLAAQLLNIPRVGLASLLEQHFNVALSKDSQKANWSRRPMTQEMLDYAALDVFYLPTLRDLLAARLAELGRTDWLNQKCRWQIEAGCTGFPPADENDWRIGRSEKLSPQGQAVLHSIWHWREATAERLDVPPFKVCGNELLVKIATTAESGAGSPQRVLENINLGKRHPRLIGDLTEAVRAGLEKDPKTLPRRRGRNTDFAPLTPVELSRQDRIKFERDRLAAALPIDPTLLATRSQLAQLARDPKKIDEVLLPWQADLLRREPSLQPQG